MTHKLPDLPYALDALAPHISRETLGYHHGKHHRAYVEKLNTLIKDTEFVNLELEEIVRRAGARVQTGGDPPEDASARRTRAILDNASQAWNHAFYWRCLAPASGQQPAAQLVDALKRAFGSPEEFKAQFAKAAMDFVGAAWAWLLMDDAGNLAVKVTSNAHTALGEGHSVLLTCDLWEHAYYIDRRNEKKSYLENYWQIINWDFLNDNLIKAQPALLLRNGERGSAEARH